jgi:PAS domain S-box-containing protein
MNGLYAYTPHLWPLMMVGLIQLALAGYSWRWRHLPGARFFTVWCLFVTCWASSVALQLAAITLPSRLFWDKSQALWALAAASAMLCFAFDIANLGRWVTRRTLALLALPMLLLLALMLTSEHHPLFAYGFTLTGQLAPALTTAGWFFLTYGTLLTLVSLLVLVWLFITSPRHRWSAALVICGLVAVRTAFLLDTLTHNPFAPLSLSIFAVVLASGLYAVALLRFRMFDPIPIPIARVTLIEQLREGMLVLDLKGQILDLNPAAERILGLPSAQARGQPVHRLLPAYADLETTGASDLAQAEFSLGHGPAVRYYALQSSPLTDRRQRALGTLILLRDSTAQRQTQARLLAQ